MKSALENFHKPKERVDKVAYPTRTAQLTFFCVHGIGILTKYSGCHTKDFTPLLSNHGTHACHPWTVDCAQPWFLDDMLQNFCSPDLDLDVNELLLFTSRSFGLISRVLYANRLRLSISQAQKIRILRCVRLRRPIILPRCLMQYELI